MKSRNNVTDNRWEESKNITNIWVTVYHEKLNSKAYFIFTIHETNTMEKVENLDVQNKVKQKIEQQSAIAFSLLCACSYTSLVDIFDSYSSPIHKFRKLSSNTCGRWRSGQYLTQTLSGRDARFVSYSYFLFWQFLTLRCPISQAIAASCNGFNISVISPLNGCSFSYS